MNTTARFRLYTVLLALVLPLCSINASNTEQQKMSEELRLVLDLTKGSHIIGIPSVSSVQLITSYGKLDLPLKNIGSIRFNDDQETVLVTLHTNEKFKGVLGLEKFTLATILGDIAIGTEHIDTISVEMAEPSLFSSSALRSGLVLHYSLDADEGRQATDNSGRGNHGVVSQGTSYTDGVMSKGIRTISKDTFVICSSAAANPNGWREFSMTVWVKPHGVSTYSNLIGFGKPDTRGGIALRIGGRQGSKFNPSFSVDLSNDPEDVVSLSLEKFAKTNEWYHIAGVYDGKMLAFYVNGEIAGTTHIPDRLKNTPVYAPTGGAFIVGKHASARSWHDTHINGVIDEVMLFDRALSANSIGQIYRKVKK